MFKDRQKGLSQILIIILIVAIVEASAIGIYKFVMTSRGEGGGGTSGGKNEE